MRLLLFSDLHLDSSFAWMGVNAAAARRLRSSLRECLLRILQLAQQEQADAILCGGDLYEQERFAPDTASFLKSSFETVQPLPIFLAPGNHDWYGPGSLYQQVDWPSNVHIFSENRLIPVELKKGCILWGAAHTGPAQHESFLSGFRVNQEGLHLGLFHGSDSSWLAQQGETKIGHAPFTSEEIVGSGLSHAFLGHYHAPKDAPAYTYPGNPQPLTFGEQGERGAVLATVFEDGRLERRRLPVAQTAFLDVAVDITGIRTTLQIKERIAAAIEGLTGIVRITVHGEMPADLDLQLADLKPDDTRLDACSIRAGDLRPAYDLGAIAGEPTVRGQFVRNVQSADLSEEHKRQILLTGLRALDGREDLEVL